MTVEVMIDSLFLISAAGNYLVERPQLVQGLSECICSVLVR